MSEEEASPPAPLQGERGGSKLRGCDVVPQMIRQWASMYRCKICEICEICGTKWRVSNWGVQFDVQKNRYPNKCAVALLWRTRNKGTGLYDPFVFDTTAIISNQSAINQQLIRVYSLLYPKWDCSWFTLTTFSQKIHWPARAVSAEEHSPG